MYSFILYLLLFCIGLFIAGIIFLLESPIDAADYSIEPGLELVGVLAPNRILTHAERILDGLVQGPESLAYHIPTQTIFAGTRDGSVVQIFIGDNSKKAKIIHTFRYMNAKANSSYCNGSVTTVKICGRPLGMRFWPNNSNLLVIIDAYHGVFKYHITNESAIHILKTGTLIKHYPSKPAIRYLNDFDFTKDGKLIISEPSYAFDDHNFHYIVLERASKGRVLLFDPESGDVEILINDLVIPNGVQMDLQKNCVFIAEMGL